ncbi:hypothetical protein [Trichococcus collinsii]|uniref:PTS system, cellobiose-specific IIB component n=1 Tax=Trichococcus collinsii TaxID=157076 RepID=A0AB38A313_9LACT|nr:hypothetical protein [Trichococcus collinsii]CZQ97665.1 phosphotransferase system eiib component type 2/3 [Trichococcus collinsii]SEA85332.1 PTS system, cellobiose-specific IIB component [Trichococcus collinsii]
MTVSIMLACTGGFSTSMLVERVKNAAKEKVDKLIQNIDILLLGPQVGYMEESVNYSRPKPRASYELLPYLRMSLQAAGMDIE